MADQAADNNDISVSMKFKSSMVTWHDRVPEGESRRMRTYILAWETQRCAIESSWALGEINKQECDSRLDQLQKRYSVLIKKEKERVERIEAKAADAA